MDYPSGARALSPFDPFGDDDESEMISVLDLMQGGGMTLDEAHDALFTESFSEFSRHLEERGAMVWKALSGGTVESHGVMENTLLTGNSCETIACEGSVTLCEAPVILHEPVQVTTHVAHLVESPCSTEDIVTVGGVGTRGVLDARAREGQVECGVGGRWVPIHECDVDRKVLIFGTEWSTLSRSDIVGLSGRADSMVFEVSDSYGSMVIDANYDAEPGGGAALGRLLKGLGAISLAPRGEKWLRDDEPDCRAYRATGASVLIKFTQEAPVVLDNAKAATTSYGCLYPMLSDELYEVDPLLERDRCVSDMLRARKGGHFNVPISSGRHLGLLLVYGDYAVLLAEELQFTSPHDSRGTGVLKERGEWKWYRFESPWRPRSPGAYYITVFAVGDTDETDVGVLRGCEPVDGGTTRITIEWSIVDSGSRLQSCLYLRLYELAVQGLPVQWPVAGGEWFLCDAFPSGRSYHRTELPDVTVSLGGDLLIQRKGSVRGGLAPFGHIAHRSPRWSRDYAHLLEKQWSLLNASAMLSITRGDIITRTVREMTRQVHFAGWAIMQYVCHGHMDEEAYTQWLSWYSRRYDPKIPPGPLVYLSPMPEYRNIWCAYSLVDSTHDCFNSEGMHDMGEKFLAACSDDGKLPTRWREAFRGALRLADPQRILAATKKWPKLPKHKPKPSEADLPTLVEAVECEGQIDWNWYNDDQDTDVAFRPGGFRPSAYSSGTCQYYSGADDDIDPSEAEGWYGSNVDADTRHHGYDAYNATSP